MIRPHHQHRFMLIAAGTMTLTFTGLTHAQYSVTVLHNNDGESRLISYSNGLPEYGGVARFATVLDQTRNFYESQNHGVVAIFAGDTFLAGPQFQASLDSGVPGSRTFYDALAISRLRYDVSILGNHEFDFGPNTLAEFITAAQTHNPTTYLSANLDFSAEAALQAHVTAGRIAPSKVITVNTAAGIKTIGIVGVTTDNLPFISSPGGVTVSSVANAINTQVQFLRNNLNVNHVIVGTHLQGLSQDNALRSSLNPGIDLIVAGGGDEILRTLGAPSPKTVYSPSAPASIVDTGLIPGDAPATLTGTLTGQTNTYPLLANVTDTGGKLIPIVTTGGNYGYLGRVTLNFDNAGNLTGIDNSSAPQRVASLTADPTHGVAPNTDILNESVIPVQNFVSGLAANKLAETSVQLLHGGSATIRSRETNLGNLVADGILRAAQQLSGTFGVGSPTIAMVNAGGIRANINAGNVSQLSTFDVSPFGNFVSVVPNVKLSDLKLLLENAFSRTIDSNPGPDITPASSDGRFAQISGMEVKYDIFKPGFRFDNSGNTLVAPQRILSITIGGIDYLIDGNWAPGIDPNTTTFNIATLNFSASGGDQWFRTAIGGNSTYLSQLYNWVTLGITDQNALQQYIQFMTGGNNSFNISTFKPEYSITQRFQGGRISAIPEPTSFALLVLSAGLLGFRRNRK